MAWLDTALPRLVLGAGGALLFASLFVPWFGGLDPTFEDGLIPGTSVSAWEAFSNVDVLLTLAVIGACVAFGLADVFELRWLYLAVVVIGGAALCLTLYAIHHPANAIPVGQGSTPQIGYLCALLGAGGITIGGLWIGLATPARNRRSSGSRPGARLRW